jgi:alpha-tubulin suppressor-like RCC1 family protein
VQVKGLNGVGYLTSVAAIASGQDHSLALKTDGALWAWGQNSDGQLGDGTLTSRATPVQVAALSNVETAAGGGYHTLAVTADGTVWAWGENGYGQLGDGTLTSHSTPAQVVGLSAGRAVAAGRVHSLALKDDGTVWAWGDDTYGQLGGAHGEPSPGARFPLCHKPGTPAEKTLFVPRRAVIEHLGHGDQPGRCR